MRRNVSVSEICNSMGLSYVGQDAEVNGLNLCNRASEHTRILTYVTSAEYVETVQKNPAIVGIVLKKEDLEVYQSLEKAWTFIVCESPEEVFYGIHAYLYNATDFYDKYEFPVKIGENCTIHSTAVVEDGVIIGNSVTIGANTVIRRGTVIGDYCTIGCNTTIGSEGFQIIKLNGRNHRISHCGETLLGERVIVGDNVTICISLFEGAVRIGCDTMIDNLAYVGHNVCIGENAVITAGTILCGSSVVEDGAWVGSNSCVLNRVTVGEQAKVGIGSVVTRDVPEKSLAYGVPARPRKEII